MFERGKLVDVAAGAAPDSARYANFLQTLGRHDKVFDRAMELIAQNAA